MMQTVVRTRPAPIRMLNTAGAQYARCIEVSKRIRWDIDRDVIRGRTFDFSRKFLPDALSKASALEFCSAPERRLLSQIQGRTYANMFGLIERYIGAKMLELSGTHGLGDQTALEALVRFTDEELKHQELFRRIERMIASEMPEGYRFDADANNVAWVVLAKSTWAVLALTCMVELFTQDHYRASIAHDDELSELYKDVFLFHWKEESQHAVLDELEWRRNDADLTVTERDEAVDDLISLTQAVDGLIQAQAAADSGYFIRLCKRAFTRQEIGRVHATVLYAYRSQYIVSGIENPRFSEILRSLVSEKQALRIAAALEPIVGYRPD